jgi:glucosamine--fructose-6-phosphate aminotransferase (isomerizing)
VAIKNTLLSLVDPDTHLLKTGLNLDWTTISRLTIVACGTSYYAASVAKYWFERFARLSVEIDIASEFRYRNPVLPEGGAALFISQSGETIDTLMAMNLAKEQGQQTIGLVNARESSIARQADHVIYTHAGPEIGVASTKAFTAQLTVLACLAIEAGRARGHLSEDQVKKMLEELFDLPTEVYHVLQKESDFKKIAEHIKEAQDVLYLGRGTNYPIAMEGALKLKELSYIHAEGCPSGEIKHGPIALIDSTVPVVVVAPSDRWMTKTLSNTQEVVARGAQAICFTDVDGKKKLEEDQVASLVVTMPMTTSLTAPVIYTIPMQLLAYYTALLRGSDVDQPRNLAKSVTVE